MKKNLYIIGGTMGVGKTTACQKLKKLLPNSVYLDGDWCWDADPFVVTDETKGMVTDNICHLLNNFIKCSAYENIIFSWVMHQQGIIDDILSRLNTLGCRVHKVSLICSEAALTARLEGDIAAGLREEDIIERSAVRLPLYDRLDTVKIDVTNLNPTETADRIANLGVI